MWSWTLAICGPGVCWRYNDTHTIGASTPGLFGYMRKICGGIQWAVDGWLWWVEWLGWWGWLVVWGGLLWTSNNVLWWCCTTFAFDFSLALHLTLYCPHWIVRFLYEYMLYIAYVRFYFAVVESANSHDPNNVELLMWIVVFTPTGGLLWSLLLHTKIASQLIVVSHIKSLNKWPPLLWCDSWQNMY